MTRTTANPKPMSTSRPRDQEGLRWHASIAMTRHCVFCIASVHILPQGKWMPSSTVPIRHEILKPTACYGKTNTRTESCLFVNMTRTTALTGILYVTKIKSRRVLQKITCIDKNHADEQTIYDVCSAGPYTAYIILTRSYESSKSSWSNIGFGNPVEKGFGSFVLLTSISAAPERDKTQLRSRRALYTYNINKINTRNAHALARARSGWLYNVLRLKVSRSHRDTG